MEFSFLDPSLGSSAIVPESDQVALRSSPPNMSKKKIEQKAAAVFDPAALPCAPVIRKRRAEALLPVRNAEQRIDRVEELQDVTATPVQAGPVRRLAQQTHSLALPSLGASFVSRTPPMQLPSSLRPSPKETPDKRYVLRVGSREGSFTPGIRGANKKMVYSLKLLTKTGATERYIGETERGIKRAFEHASKLRQRDDIEEASFGVLALSDSREELDRLETAAIEKVQRVYGKRSVLNKRRGGGGGAVSQEVSSRSEEEAVSALDPLLRDLSWRPLTNLLGRIGHQFSSSELQAKKVLYVFERTFPHGVKKRYVGVTLPSFEKRLGAHLGHATAPETSKLQDRTLYEDMHAYWDQFHVSYLSIESLLTQGYSSRQLEKTAIKILHGFPGGYNLNQGGGGGVPKKA